MSADVADEEVTKRARPVMNADNVPLVDVLYHLGNAIELSATSVADGLRDIAKTIQLTPDPVTDLMRERIARVVEEHAIVVKVGAQRIREAT